MTHSRTASRAEELFTTVREGGERAIDELVASRANEELYLDFKRSSTNGNGVRLSQNDRDNLAKAVSGFGNSEGGIVIWGIDCSSEPSGADVAHTKVLLKDAQKFVSWLEGAVSGVTVPPHSGVRSIAIPMAESSGGYVATLIPRSPRAPHQVTRHLRYYIRAGSDFVHAPHMVLAGMFGRPYQPDVRTNFVTQPATIDGNTVEVSVGIMLVNAGPGIARDLFATLRFLEVPDSPSSFAFEPADRSNWSGNMAFGRVMSLISEPNMRVPPEAMTLPVCLRATLTPPFAGGIHWDGVVGAGESVPYRFDAAISQEQLESLHSGLIEASRNGPLTEEACQKFTAGVMGIDQLRRDDKST